MSTDHRAAESTEPGDGPGVLEDRADVDDPRDDATLLADHVAGDPKAFAILVGRHQGRLWAIALRTMRDPEEAAEALQEAYIHAFRRAETFRGEAKVTTWLHRIVVNASLDRIRRNKVRRTEALPDDLDRMAELAADTVDAGDAVAAKDLQQDVASALAQLNPDQRAAVVLVDMEGYSVVEAAAMLGCAPGTVKSRCFRARAKLAPLVAHLKGRG